MKKNAILAMILAGTMAAAMTSCGPKEEASSPETPALQSSEEQYNETVTEAEEEVVIEPTQEILDAELADNKIQLSNRVYALPVTLQQLLDDGAEVTDGTSPANTILEASNSMPVNLSIDDIDYELHFVNEDENVKQIKDCYLEDAGFYYYGTDKKPDKVIFAKGIRIGSSISDLKAAWGEPLEDNLNKLLYIDNNHEYVEDERITGTINSYQYTVYLDLEKQVITNIEYVMNYDYYSGKYNLVDNADAAETITEESETETSEADGEPSEASDTE